MQIFFINKNIPRKNRNKSKDNINFKYNINMHILCGKSIMTVIIIAVLNVFNRFLLPLDFNTTEKLKVDKNYGEPGLS